MSQLKRCQEVDDYLQTGTCRWLALSASCHKLTARSVFFKHAFLLTLTGQQKFPPANLNLHGKE